MPIIEFSVPKLPVVISVRKFLLPAQMSYQNTKQIQEPPSWLLRQHLMIAMAFWQLKKERTIQMGMVFGLLRYWWRWGQRPHALELDTENADGDNDPLTNPKDTDGDLIPIIWTLTTITMVSLRYEDANGDLDPTNDITDGNGIPDYLNSNVSNEHVVNLYRNIPIPYQVMLRFN